MFTRLIERSWFEDSQQRAAEDMLRELALAEQFLDDPNRADNMRASFAAARRDVVVGVDGQAVASDPTTRPELPTSLREAVTARRRRHR